MMALILATAAEARPLLARLKARLWMRQGVRRTATIPLSAEISEPRSASAATTGAPTDMGEIYWYPAQGSRSGGLIVISGMGRAAAARAAEYAIAARGATRVINCGVCGALRSDLQPGQLVRIERTLDGDVVLQEKAADASLGEYGAGVAFRNADAPYNGAATVEILSARPASAVATALCAVSSPSLNHGMAMEGSDHLWPSVPVRCLATVTEPVFQPERRARLALVADVVDMEGWAVADTCRRHGVPCHLLKGVTDRADATGQADIARRMETVSDAVAEAVVAGLETMPGTGDGLIGRLMRFTRIEHTIFSLPLLAAGAWLGAGRQWPSWRVLGLIALAGVGARALGMAMNRIFDRDLDLLNRRTAGRELPAGGLRLTAAYGAAGAGLAAYLLACALLGPLCLALAPVPAVPLLVYALLKRFTRLCHYGIGLCLGLAPLGAYVAVSGGLDFTPAAWALALFAFCWISGFDIIYALQDEASDRETGVHSLPAALGGRRAQMVAALTHAVSLGALCAVWGWGRGGWWGGVCVLVAAGAFAAAYWPSVPLPIRFFPISAVAGVAGALVCF